MKNKTDRKYRKLLSSKSLEKYTIKQLKRINRGKHKKEYQLWIPSIKSTIWVIIVIFLTIFLQHVYYHYLKWNIPFTVINDNILINIHIGIGAMLTGLVFFVAHGIINRDDPNLKKVLLYKSNLFPLATAEIISLLSLLVVEPKYLVSTVFLIGIFTINSLAQIIIILINDDKMSNAKIEMYVSLLIDLKKKNDIKKLGKAYLMDVGKMIEKETGSFVKFSVWPPMDDQNFTSINLYEKGFIKDINIKKFHQFLKILYKGMLQEIITIEITNNVRPMDLAYGIYYIPSFYEESSGNNLYFRNSVNAENIINKARMSSS